MDKENIQEKQLLEMISSSLAHDIGKSININTQECYFIKSNPPKIRTIPTHGCGDFLVTIDREEFNLPISGDLKYESLTRQLKHLKQYLKEIIVLDFITNNLNRNDRQVGYIRTFLEPPIKYISIGNNEKSLFSYLSEKELSEVDVEKSLHTNRPDFFRMTQYETIMLMNTLPKVIKLPLDVNYLLAKVHKYENYLSETRLNLIKDLIQNRVNFINNFEEHRNNYRCYRGR